MNLINILIIIQGLLACLALAAPTVKLKSATSTSLTYTVTATGATAGTYFVVKSSDGTQTTNAVKECESAVLLDDTTKTCDIVLKQLGANTLTENTSYQFSFYAVEPGQESDSYSDATISAVEWTKLSVVTINENDITSDKESFSFKIAPNAGVTDYQVSYTKDGVTQEPVLCTWDASTNSCKVASLESNKKYTFTVAAKNSAGADDWSEQSAFFDAYTLPVAPTITFTKITSTQIVLNIESTDGATQFDVIVRSAGNEDIKQAVSSTYTIVKFNDKELTAETDYSISGKAIGINSDKSAESASQTVKTFFAAVPRVLLPTTKDTSALIQWTDDANVNKYKLYYKKLSDQEFVEKIQITEMKYYISGLEANQQKYFYYVISYDDSDPTQPKESEVKKNYFFTKAAPTTAPTYTADKLKFENVSENSITLNFEAADDELVEYYYVSKKEGAVEESAYTADEADKVQWDNSKVFDSLLSGTTYTFFVIAQNSFGGTKVFKTQQTLFTKMDPPTASESESNQHSQIKLTWTAVSGAFKYKIKIVAETAASYVLINDGTKTDTIITGLTPNTLYKFQIAALNSNSNSNGNVGTFSEFSDQFSTEFLPRPIDVVVLKIYDTSAKFSWDQVDGATSYKLYYRQVGETAFTSKAQILGQTYLLEKSLVAQTNYEYYIATVGKDDKENSQPSSFETFTTLAEASTAPTIDASSFTFSDVTSTEVKIIFTPVADDYIYQYKVSYKETESSSDFANEDSIETDKVISGLTTNTLYTFKIVAYNSKGEAGADKDQWTLPSDVASLTPSASTVNSIVLNWEEVTPNNQITYTIGIFPPRTDSSTEVTGITGATATIDQLQSNKEYTFTIKAINTESTLSSVNLFTSASQYTKPEKAQNLQVTIGENKLIFSFDQPEEGLTQTCSYQVKDAETWEPYTCDGFQQSYKIPSLTNGITYTVKVVLQRDTLESEAATAEGIFYTTPAAFTKLPTAVAKSDSEITVSWTKNTGDNYTAFKVYIKEKDGSEPENTNDVSDGNLNSYKFTGLKPATLYQFAVMGINVDQEGPKSDYVEVYTGLVSLSIESSTVNSLTYKFGKTLGDGVTYTCKYKVSSAEDSEYKISDCSSSATNTYLQGGLVAATDYTVQVIATKESVNGPESIATKVTLPGQANPPTYIEQSLTQNSLTLEWVKNEGAITKYKVIQEKDGKVEQTYEVDAPAVTKDISGLSNQAYKFYIQAVNAAGEGEKSTALDITIFSEDSKVSDLTFTQDSGADKLVFTFSKNLGNNVEYTCQYKKSADNSTYQYFVNCTADSGTYTISSLDPATKYTVSVSPKQTKPTKVQGTVSTYDYFTKPGQAYKPTPSGAKGTSFKLNWVKNEGTITGYKVYQGDKVINITADGDTQTFEVTGLQTQTFYTFKISAINDAGEGKQSIPLSLQTPLFTNESKVKVTIFNLADTSLQFSFDKNLGDGVNYECQFKKTDGGSYEDFDDCANKEGPYTLVNLDPTKQYNVKVVGKYFYDYTSEFITGADAIAEDYTLPSKVKNLVLSEPSATTLKATWNSTTNSITKYKVYVEDQTPIETTDTKAQFTITGLISATSYKVQVSAMNGDDEGAKSDVKEKFTLPAKANTPTEDAKSETSVTIKWASNTQGTTTGYKVWKGEESILVGKNLTHTFDGLTANTKYSFQIQALNGEDEGLKSDVLEVTMKPAPVSIKISGVKKDSFTFIFTKVADITYVCIYKPDRGEDQTFDCSSEKGPWTISNLAASTQYTVKVVGTNNGGSTDSQKVATTLPLQITNLEAEVENATSLKLTWSKQEGTLNKIYQDDELIAEIPLSDSYTVTGLTIGRKYKFAVSVKNSAGEGEISESIIAATHSGSATITLKAQTYNSITIEWTQISDATSYLVKHNDKSFETKDRKFTLTELVQTESYLITVEPKDGFGLPSTLQVGLSEPTPVEIIPQQNQITVKFNSPNFGVKISWKKSDSKEDFSDPVELDAGSSQHIIRNLLNTQPYTIKIQTIGKDNKLTEGFVGEATPQVKKIDPPDNFYYTNVTSTTVSFAWVNTDQEMKFQIKNVQTEVLYEIKQGANSTNITGLVEGQRYLFAIQSFNELTKSAWSYEIKVKTNKNDNPPSKTAKFNVEAISETSLLINIQLSSINNRRRLNSDDGYILQYIEVGGQKYRQVQFSQKTYMLRYLTERAIYRLWLSVIIDGNQTPVIQAPNAVQMPTAEEIKLSEKKQVVKPKPQDNTEIAEPQTEKFTDKLTKKLTEIEKLTNIPTYIVIIVAGILLIVIICIICIAISKCKQNKKEEQTKSSSSELESDTPYETEQELVVPSRSDNEQEQVAI